jgi:hypothetical protein
MPHGIRSKMHRSAEDYMLFLLLIHHDEGHWISLPDGVRAGVYKDYRAFAEKTTKDGSYREGGELETSSSAVVVRVRNGITATSGGPFEERREQLAGFFLIEAADIDAAIAIAAQIPGARDGSIEVRAVRAG